MSDQFTLWYSWVSTVNTLNPIITHDRNDKSKKSILSFSCRSECHLRFVSLLIKVYLSGIVFWQFLRWVICSVQGFRDLVWLPIEQYRKDGRIVRGFQRGTASFGTSTAMAALELTNRMVRTIQVNSTGCIHSVPHRFCPTHCLVSVVTMTDGYFVNVFERESKQETAGLRANQYAQLYNESTAHNTRDHDERCNNIFVYCKTVWFLGGSRDGLWHGISGAWWERHKEDKTVLPLRPGSSTCGPQRRCRQSLYCGKRCKWT